MAPGVSVPPHQASRLCRLCPLGKNLTFSDWQWCRRLRDLLRREKESQSVAEALPLLSPSSLASALSFAVALCRLRRLGLRPGETLHMLPKARLHKSGDPCLFRHRNRLCLCVLTGSSPKQPSLMIVFASAAAAGITDTLARLLLLFWML